MSIYNEINRDLNNEILQEILTLKAILLKREKPFIAFSDACVYLGISKHTLYGYTSKGIIPFYKNQGRRIYFKIEDLDGFILDKKNRVSSKEEIEVEAATYLLIKRDKKRRR